MKRLIHKKTFPIIAVLLVTLAIVLFFHTIRSYLHTSNTTNQTDIQYTTAEGQTYTSDFLKIAFNVPQGFIVDESFNLIQLSNDGKELVIERIATNHNDITDYLVDFDSKRTVIIKSEKLGMLDSYKAIARIERFEDGSISEEKLYTAIINGWVYTFSTSSSELYDELDQIAQSFTYLD